MQVNGIAVANAFVYFVRFGMVDWIPTYLQTAKQFSFQQSSVAWAAFEFAGIPGTILCGWVSDRYFRGRRAPATILFMALTLLGLIAYGLNQRGPLWIDIAALVAIGFCVYGPIMVIGLGIDPPAAGIVGLSRSSLYEPVKIICPFPSSNIAIEQFMN